MKAETVMSQLFDNFLEVKMTKQYTDFPMLRVHAQWPCWHHDDSSPHHFPTILGLKATVRNAEKNATVDFSREL